MVILLNGASAATLSAGVPMPVPPLLPSIAKSESVTPLELISSIEPPVEEFLRFNVVPNLPAPCNQIAALIETLAPGSTMHVPGGMMSVAFPKLAVADANAAWSAAESSVEPSHFIPVAKTGLIMHVLLMEQVSTA